MAELSHQSSRTAAQQWLRPVIFVVWLAVVVALSIDHAVWRDEMRALSFALQGETVADMIRRLHGEGHPALWYLLLRGAYALVHDTVVLKLVAVAVGAAAALILLVRSPFPPWLIVLLMAGKFMLFEYSVMARNYGVGMLLMFAVAAAYPKYRNHGVVIGVLLFLLANSSVGATLLIAAFLLFWVIETVVEFGFRWTPAMRRFAINAAIALLGVALCAALVYPPFNDAAAVDAGTVTPMRLLIAVVRPAGNFARSFVYGPWAALGGTVETLPYPGAVKWLVSTVMFASLLGLVRRPAALTAALAALIANSLFFTVIYPGQYRHQALWLVFLTMMYWIVRTPGTGPEIAVPQRRRTVVDGITTIGFAAFVALLALQVPSGVGAVVDLVRGDQPTSQSRDLARLIAADPRLRDAVVMADPDFFIESVPYYVDNPTYLIRQQRFGRYAAFTTKARLDLSLADILDTAQATSARTRRPVIILLAQRLDPSAPPARIAEGYNWTLTTTPVQVRAFQAGTVLLASFGAARSLETFDVYLLAARR